MQFFKSMHSKLGLPLHRNKTWCSETTKGSEQVRRARLEARFLLLRARELRDLSQLLTDFTGLGNHHKEDKQPVNVMMFYNMLLIFKCHFNKNIASIFRRKETDPGVKRTEHSRESQMAFKTVTGIHTLINIFFLFQQFLSLLGWIPF